MMDNIFQFTNIARPGIIKKTRYRLGLDGQMRIPQTFAIKTQKVLDQRRNIAAALSQWQKPHFGDMQAIVQIGAKVPCFYCRF